MLQNYKITATKDNSFFYSLTYIDQLLSFIFEQTEG